MGQLTKDEVFALAVQRYSDTVFRAAMHNCSCTADAEDVVQDVFEKLLRYEGRFESEEHLKAWLLRVAINRCRDITRAARQKDTELDENIPAPESGNDGSVLDAVRTLPENYRNAVYLHYYEGYTAAEVGRMLGAPTNTVLSWLPAWQSAGSACTVPCMPTNGRGSPCWAAALPPTTLPPPPRQPPRRPLSTP